MLQIRLNECFLASFHHILGAHHILSESLGICHGELEVAEWWALGIGHQELGNEE